MKIDGLTVRQDEIARLVADCLTTKQIADRLGVNVSTVNFHIDRIVTAWALDRARDAHAQIALRYRRRLVA